MTWKFFNCFKGSALEKNIKTIIVLEICQKVLVLFQAFLKSRVSVGMKILQNKETCFIYAVLLIFSTESCLSVSLFSTAFISLLLDIEAKEAVGLRRKKS